MTESFQLLQINIVSARDLASVSKTMHTYAVGWINPDRKLTTRVDHKGNNCPEWNDRFVFKVTPKFLNSESSTIEIEIYSQAWLRDTLVGYVRVLIANLLPANGSTRRSVSLQIRRPSGRPQGILHANVSIVDGSRRSMPLSGVGPSNEKGDFPKPDPEQGSIVLRRAKSERSLSNFYNNDDQDTKALRPPTCSSLGGSLCNSDVGPSASVVAAAMAKGIHMQPTMAQHGRGRGRGRGRGGFKGNNHDDEGSSILQCEDEPSEEGLNTKIERWKMELNKQSHNHKGDHHHTGNKDARHKHHNKHHRRSKTEGGRVFRCFGKAYGFEFTIVCGGNQDNNDKHKKNGKKKVQHRSPSDDDANSQSYIVL
ncbi:Protein SRC2 [Bienertia sinuspersici]